VIQTGNIVMEDKTENLQEDEMVRKLYLGGEIE
jgi:ABC-type lipopolysaccharide export system ATPase subunit